MITEWQKKLPMRITFFRMYMVPMIIGFLYFNILWTNLVAAALFIITSISDYYDGYFARKYKAVSDMGKIMDPVADKVLVTSVLIFLLYLNKIDPFMVIIILARDNFISGVRAAAASENLVIAAKPSGKWKTALQMIAIPAIIINQTVEKIPFILIGNIMLWVSVVLSLTSGAEYYYDFLKARRPKKIS